MARSTTKVRRLLSALLGARVAVLFGAVLVTGAALASALALRIDANLIALLPPHTESVRALDALLEETGGAGDLMVMFESSDADASVAAAERMLPRVRALPSVEDARFGYDTDFSERNALLYMELADLREAARRVDDHLDQEIYRQSPFYIELNERPQPLDLSDLEQKYRAGGAARRYFASDDGQVLLMVVRPRGITGDIPFVRRIHRELSDLVAAEDTSDLPAAVRLSVGGTFKNRLDEYDTLTSDLRSSALWVCVAIALFISLFFRSPVALPIVGVPLAMGLVWTFALANVIYGSLNTITVFLIVILMGLGIDFGVHVLARFQRERAAGRDLLDTLSATVDTAGRASVTAALTTAASFFALVFTDFTGFSQFGVIAGLGLVCTAIAYVVVMPPILAWVFERDLMRPPARPDATAPRGRPLPFARAIVLAAVAITAVALWFGQSAAFEYDLRNVRSRVEGTRAFNEKMRLVFRQARDPAAVLVRNDEEARATVARLEALREAQGETSPIAGVKSVRDLLPLDVDAKLAIIDRLRERVDRLVERVPEVDERTRAVTKLLRPDRLHAVGDLPPSLTRPFLGRSGGGQIVYIFQKSSLLDLRNAAAFSDSLRGVTVAGRPLRAASEPLVFADVLRVVTHDAPVAVGLALLVLVVVLLVDFRSVAAALLVLLPLAVGLSWMVGAMGALDVKLNLFNAAVLPAAVGLGIDGGVHVYHGFRDLGATRMTAIFGDVGAAVFASSATSMISFGCLLGAAHPGLRSIGALALIGLATCLAAAVLVLPATLTLWYREHPGSGR